MYLTNKYSKWYNNIVSAARARTAVTGYTEKHHIIPKSLGGTNNKSNLVVLTAREHFVCHWLLTKMTTGTAKIKMWNAMRIIFVKSKGQERYSLTSRKYEVIRRQCSVALKGTQTGKNNGNYGKRWTEEQRAKMRGHTRNVGRIRSAESNNKQSASMKGKNTGQQTLEHIQKRFIKKSCPHCGTIVSPTNFHRWHNNNCKQINTL